MRLKFFFVPLEDEGIEGELNRFLASHRVVGIEKCFVQAAGRVGWAVAVNYSAADTGSVVGTARRSKQVDYREVLSEAEFEVYARLRTVRKELAEKDAVPAYAVFTNEQLAEMVRRNVRPEEWLSSLSSDIREEYVRLGNYRSFVLHDPKRRIVHAPAFRERVLHHALVARMEPAFERGHLDDTFACRPGRGSLRAARRVQSFLRAHPWYVQVDVRSFFASVNHAVLARQLRRRFKSPGLLRLCDGIIGSFSTPGG